MGGAERVRVGRTHTASRLFPTTAAESIVFMASDELGQEPSVNTFSSKDIR